MTKILKLFMREVGLVGLYDFWRRYLSPFEGAPMGEKFTAQDEEREAQEWLRERMYKRRIEAMRREGWI